MLLLRYLYKSGKQHGIDRHRQKGGDETMNGLAVEEAEREE